eukprot:7382563-Prymnesium_polylepis.1
MHHLPLVPEGRHQHRHQQRQHAEVGRHAAPHVREHTAPHVGADAAAAARDGLTQPARAAPTRALSALHAAPGRAPAALQVAVAALLALGARRLGGRLLLQLELQLLGGVPLVDAVHDGRRRHDRKVAEHVGEEPRVGRLRLHPRHPVARRRDLAHGVVEGHVRLERLAERQRRVDDAVGELVEAQRDDAAVDEEGDHRDGRREQNRGGEAEHA